MQPADERKIHDLATATRASSGRRPWAPPMIVRAGTVSDLVQVVKASGDTDCGGLHHPPGESCGGL